MVKEAMFFGLTGRGSYVPLQINKSLGLLGTLGGTGMPTPDQRTGKPTGKGSLGDTDPAQTNGKRAETGHLGRTRGWQTFEGYDFRVF